MRRKRLLTSTWQTSLAYNQMLGQNVINTFWFERPLWVAVDPFTAEEEAPEVEEFIYHRPVLESEVLELLEPKPGSLIVDATCGGGGHTEAFLESGANVLALDRDPDAIQHVGEQLARFGKRLALRQANFRCAISVLDELGIRTIDGALLDIGVSSRQLENSERGFSFMRNGPLDMRMDPRAQLTAAAIVNEYSEEQLTRLFRELGEEPAARRIASLIVKNFFRDHSREWLDKPEWPAPQRNPDYDLKLITPKPVEPTEEERRMNPRSRSAKLRVAEKT